MKQTQSSRLGRGFAPLFLLGLLAAPSSAAAYNFISELGCAPSQGAAWSMRNGPSRWYIEDGFLPVDREVVTEVLKASIGAWGEPCCSNFAHQFEGFTTGSAMDMGNSANIVGFTRDWPPEFGSVNATIAVTLPITTLACQIPQADMVFNAQGFTFRTDGRVTDLQSIATHEFGHWVGLDHTTVRGATMTPYYSNGTDERTLEQDDIDGVCALYTVSCGTCSSDAECGLGEICQDGACVKAGCTRNDDCAAGTICWNGTCTPGCRSDAECGAGESCRVGECVPESDECVVCKRCNNDRQCGEGNAFCIDLGNGGRCTQTCGTNADCPGDSACILSQDGSGNVVGLCFSPDAFELCPSDYTCDPHAAPTCARLWQRCNDDVVCGGSQCISTETGSRCSCICVSDADCGEDGACVADGKGASYCRPSWMVDPCESVQCAPGSVCREGTCVDVCDGVTCAEGESCVDGSCVSPCGVCPNGTVCDPGSRTCKAGGLCEGVSCGAGEVCRGGVCVDASSCGDTPCGAGETCVDGVCRPAGEGGSGGESGGGSAGGKSGGGKKSGGCSSADGAPALLGLLTCAAPWLRKRRAR